MVTQTKKSFPTEQLVVLVSEHVELYDLTNKLYHNIYPKEYLEDDRPPPSPSPPPQPPQQQQQQEFGPMRVKRGRKRQATAAITPYQQQVLSAISKEENEHERFLLSFAPTLARLEPRKQALLKCQIQSLFYDIEFGE
ncbi:unnamed protein product [Boreogadus saida]